MMRLRNWMRVALLDLRGDLRRFGMLLACLALGTAAIAAVGSVGAGLKAAVVREANTLLGGDLEVLRPDRDADATELQFMTSLGEVTHVVDSNARAEAGENSAFLDLVAVGDNYPLLGAVVSPQLSGGLKPSALLTEQDSAFGALVDVLLLERLGISLGGRFTIGQTQFEARGILTSLPDGAVRGFHVGLTTLISDAALATLSDLRAPLPGLLTQHRYKVVLQDQTYEAAAATLAGQLTDPEWQVRSPREAAGSLARYYDLFARFLLIVGLSSLLVGGVGVSTGVASYVEERQRSIATMRSLGATGARILVHFLTQIGVLTGVGVALGVIAGAVASAIALPFIGRALAVNLPPSIDAPALLIAAGFGLLAGFAFSYLPLANAQKISPASLFRSVGSAADQLRWRDMLHVSVLLPMLLAGGGIYALAVYSTGDIGLVNAYALGALLAFIVLRIAGWLLQAAARRVPQLRSRSVGYALRNIYRPGATAPIVVMSLGLGLTMILVIALLNSNLRNQLLGVVSKDAPTFVATDLFDDEIVELEDMAKTNPALARFQWSPSTRASVTSVAGTDPTQFKDAGDDAALLLGSDLPVTWRRDAPGDGTIVDGEWWPEDYAGPPLVSLRSSLKTELGLKVGDIVEFDLFGDKVEAKVANFRDYQWQNGLNFIATFSPGSIEAYPYTYLGALKAAPGEEKTLERDLSDAFPEVAFIPIGDALVQAANVLGQLATGVNIVGGLAVLNGILVLAGTLAAGRKQREADAVIQKVLGATRGNVLWVFTLEYGLLGAYSALIATAIGTVAAWAISTSALNIGFGADPALVGIIVAGAVVVTIVAGAVTTWQSLSSSPAQFLREA